MWDIFHTTIFYKQKGVIIKYFLVVTGTKSNLGVHKPSHIVDTQEIIIGFE